MHTPWPRVSEQSIAAVEAVKEVSPRSMRAMTRPPAFAHSAWLEVCFGAASCTQQTNCDSDPDEQLDNPSVMHVGCCLRLC